MIFLFQFHRGWFFQVNRPSKTLKTVPVTGGLGEITHQINYQVETSDEWSDMGAL